MAAIAAVDSNRTSLAPPQLRPSTDSASRDSPIPIRMGLLDSRAAPAPRPAAPCTKKTRDLPDLCLCHGCGLRYPDKGRSGSLRRLESQWRVVLLCPSCFAGVRSRASCSYCLSRPSEAEETGFIDCVKCRCRVHRACVPRQRGYVVPSDLDPRLFVCVDCCAVPKFLRPRVDRLETERRSGNSLEDVVSNANYMVAKKEEEALRAKEKAAEKVLVARHATELARSALNLVAVVSEGAVSASEVDLADEELALQLHRAMNGSRRILRSHRSSDSGDLASEGRDVCKESSSRRNADSKFEVCMENKSSGAYVENLDVDFGMGRVSSPNVSLGEGSVENKSNVEEGPSKEEQASCSEKVVASAVGDNSVDSISVPPERLSGSYVELDLCNGNVEGGGIEVASRTNPHTECNMPDRYLRKYCRNFKTKRYGKMYCRNKVVNRADENKRKGSASVFLSCQSMNSSNNFRSISNLQCGSLTAVLDASANATQSSACKS